MKSPRSPRRRALLLSLSVFALFIPSSTAFANHSDDHTTGVPDNANVDTVTVCHVPPADGVPSEILTIPNAALDGHLGHGDFLLTPGQPCPATTPPPPPPPAPTDVCPNIAGDQATVPDGQVVVDGQCVTPAAPEGPGTTPTPDASPATPTAEGSTPDATPDAAAADGEPNVTADDTSVEATAGAADVPVGETTAGAAQVAGGELPFTGAPTWIVALAGMLLVLSGTMLHRRAARVATAQAQH